MPCSSLLISLPDVLDMRSPESATASVQAEVFSACCDQFRAYHDHRRGRRQVWLKCSILFQVSSYLGEGDSLTLSLPSIFRASLCSHQLSTSCNKSQLTLGTFPSSSWPLSFFSVLDMGQLPDKNSHQNGQAASQYSTV